MTIQPRPTREIASGDPNLDRVQEDIARRTTEQNNSPFANGIVTDLALVPGSNVVEHKLGRVPEGYIVLRSQGCAPAFYDTAADEKRITLVLAGVANYTGKVWLY